MDKLIIYHETLETEEWLQDFQRLYYSGRMRYFASDLLKKGISPADLKDAFQRAIKVSQSSGIEVEKHFMPVYTQHKEGLVNDCKLSKLGYAMVLINANPELPIVGEWQLKILNVFLNKT